MENIIDDDNIWANLEVEDVKTREEEAPQQEEETQSPPPQSKNLQTTLNNFLARVDHKALGMEDM